MPVATPNHAHHRQDVTGVTLIELLVGVTVLAVLLAIGTPSFAGLLARWRLQAAVDGFVGDLQLARTSATRSSRRVVICALDAARPDRCTAGQDWMSGWVVFTDGNANGRLDADETEIARRAPPPGMATLQHGSAPAVLTFRPNGTLLQINARLTLQAAGDATPAEYIILNSVGRARVSHACLEPAPSSTPLLRRMGGATLVEVLIALLVISVGLLGMARLSAASIGHTKSSQVRLSAQTLVQNHADRVRLNLYGYDLGAYDQPLDAAPPDATAPAPDADDRVGALNVARQDQRDFMLALDRLLPNARSVVVSRASTSQRNLDVWVAEESNNNYAPVHVAHAASRLDNRTPGFSYAICSAVDPTSAGSATCTSYRLVTLRHDDASSVSLPTPHRRTECVGNVCTAAQERANVMNWYRYYLTRMAATQTAMGLAFSEASQYLRRRYSATDTHTGATLPPAFATSPRNDPANASYRIVLIENGDEVAMATQPHTYTLRAVRAGNMADDRCGDLQITHTGQRGQHNADTGASLAQCFKGG